jgi:hypothetical protein
MACNSLVRLGAAGLLVVHGGLANKSVLADSALLTLATPGHRRSKSSSGSVDGAVAITGTDLINLDEEPSNASQSEMGTPAGGRHQASILTSQGQSSYLSRSKHPLSCACHGIVGPNSAPCRAEVYPNDVQLPREM